MTISFVPWSCVWFNGAESSPRIPAGRRRPLYQAGTALLVLSCVFLLSCSRGSRPSAAQAPLPKLEPESPSAVTEPVRQAESTPDLSASRDPAPEVEAPEALPEILLDPEGPAVPEDEVALLDELIELSLPEAPGPLTHEEALLHTRSELPLVMNADVKRRISYFTGSRRGIATVRVSLARGNAYRPMIERVLEEEDVPAELYYLAMAESGYRPKARSHAHATGMWQFISSRGKQYGLKQDRFQDLRYDAEAATRAAAKHLKDLYIEFQDWYLAMAAYNCGPNRVKRAIRRTGSRDFWTLVRRRVLPRETRSYVPIILAMVYVGQNLDLFEFEEIDYAPELRYDTVRTHEEVSFELIADATGSSVDAVKDLNQSLFRSTTPNYAYDLRVPAGSGDRLRSELALVPPGKRSNWRRYEVRSGETLAAIAHRYRVKQDELVSLNSLSEETELQGGMRLTIPTTTRTKIYRYYGGGGAGGLLEPGTGRYRIASGDTLGGIARRFRTTVAKLMDWNGLPSTRIRAGRYLIVYPPGTSAPTSAPTSAVASGTTPTGRYTVRRGDTLSAIGSRVGASVAQLRSWNGLRGSLIRVGQVLKVPGPPPQAVAQAPARSPSSPGPAPSPNHYLIRSGDTLSVIAGRFGVSVADLRRWNGVRGSRITAGKYLIVRPPSERAAAPASGRSGISSTHYLVRRGDNLNSIAQRHGTTVRNLMAWNNLRSTRIMPNQRLVVSGSAPVAGSTQNYRVRSGDSLSVIARRFNVTVADLKRWNGLRSSSIRAGRTLVIRSSGT